MRISIHRLLEIPLIEGALIYCVVEYNSSFYVLQLSRFECENRIVEVSEYDNALDKSVSLKAYMVLESDCDALNDELKAESLSSDDDAVKKKNAFRDAQASSNVISRILNLNSHKNIDKKSIVMNRTIVYNEDACFYIPMFKNASQEIVWIHLFANDGFYTGSCSITDMDFSISEPVAIKTCVLKIIDSINPLNGKRLGLSDYSNEESMVLNKTSAKTAHENGLIELSIYTPKHLGNFFDPCVISYGSPNEYLSNATHASIAGCIQMLIANIKRLRVSYNVIKNFLYSTKRVFEFKSMWVSFFWLFYFILVFGIFPNKILLLSLIPLVFYIISMSPTFTETISNLLLRYPIFIAILPTSLIYDFLLLPKFVCTVCARKASFLETNATQVAQGNLNNNILVTRNITLQTGRKSTSNKLSLNSNRKMTFCINNLPLITSKYRLNDFINYKEYAGTTPETCHHQGLILSYISASFLTNFGGYHIFDKLRSSPSIIKAFHEIFYTPPPYRLDHVPFAYNFLYTLLYYIYMLIITFNGGISNLQILHLLHRNHLFCKLSLESVNKHMVSEHVDTERLKKIYIYENERRVLFGQYTRDNLRFYERDYFSTENGNSINIPDMSKYNIKLIVTAETDGDGWMYAKNWNSIWSPENTMLTFVRRRKWLLTLKDANTDRILKKLSALKFTNTNSHFFDINKNHFSDGIDHRSIESQSVPGSRAVNSGIETRVRGERIGTDRRIETVQRDITGSELNEVAEAGTPIDFKDKDADLKMIKHGSTISKKYKRNDSPFNIKNLFSKFKQRKDNAPNMITIFSHIYPEIESHPRKRPGLSKLETGDSEVTMQLDVSDVSGFHPLESPSSSQSLRLPDMGYKELKLNRSSQSSAGDTTFRSAATFRGDSEYEAHKNLEKTSIEKKVILDELPGVNSLKAVTPITQMSGLQPFDYSPEYDDMSSVDSSSPTVTSKPYSEMGFWELAFAVIIGLPFCLLLDFFRMLVGVFKFVFLVSDGLKSERFVYNSKYFRCKLLVVEGATVFLITKKKERGRIRLYKRNNDKFDVLTDDEFSVLDSCVMSANALMPDDDGVEEDCKTASDEDAPGDRYDDIKIANTSDAELYDVQFSNRAIDIDSNITDLPLLLSETDRESGDDLNTPVIADVANKRTNFYNYLKNIYNNSKRKKDDNILSEDEQDSGGDDENVHGGKMGVIEMLRKAKDQIVLANYKMNLYTMRFEKFLNMFSWKNHSVTKIIIIIILSIIICNYVVNIETLILIYLLLQFKRGYLSGSWERYILYTTKRHLDKTLFDLDIYKPFWDLSKYQINALAKQIKTFSTIELSVTTIREAKDKWHLAHTITNQLIHTKFAKSSKRHDWLYNLFIQTPSQQYS